MMVKRQLYLAVVLIAFLLGQAPASLLAADPPQTRPHLPGTPQSPPPPPSSRKPEQPRLHDEMFREFETNLLRVFGMKARPKLSGAKPIIPKYMRDLYNKHKEHTLPTSGRGYLPANTVRSFYHQDDHPNNCDEEDGWTLTFNVSNIVTEEILTAADLRIFLDSSTIVQNTFSTEGGFTNSSTGNRYYNCNMAANQTGSDTNGNACKKKRSLRVEVHEILLPSSSSRRRVGECITRLLDTKLVPTSPSSPSSWLVFDVHPAVHKWRNQPRLNYGLSVRVYTASRTPLSVQPHRHIRLKRDASMEHDAWHNSRPLLVTYSDDGKAAPISSRQRRSAKHRRDRGKKKGRRSKKTQRRRKASLECRRHPMYVSFSEVGWMEWIVAPSGYQAYFCEGKCLFPISDYLNTTNHAIVQTLVNSVMPNKIPRACCVPTDLSAISMLYVDEQEKVVLKTYQDMIVNACGCR